MNKTIKGILIFLVCSAAHISAGITYDMTVAQDGTGNYKTMQEAFNAVTANSSTRTVIYIKNGTYTEKLTLAATKKNVTIIGQNRDSVILNYNDYSGKVVNGDTIGTSTSSSTYIYGEGFCAINVSFKNSAGKVGQALAIYISGDKAIFYNCNFLGNQDTWYAGNCRQFMRKCYIEGTTDFMFGPSTAWVDSSNIYSYGGSALTAASTAQYVTYGYVFQYCSISGASGVSTCLGRPWRPYAAVSFQYCTMSSCITAAGWSNWGNTSNESTARYSEYKNTGSGASTTGRVTWADQLTAAEAAKYTIANVLKTTYDSLPDTDNWDPLTTLALYSSVTTKIKETTIRKYVSGDPDFKVIPYGKAYSGQFSVKISGIRTGMPLTLLLYSPNGRLIYSKPAACENFIFSIPVSKGTYFCKVKSCGMEHCKKVYVQ